MPSFRSGLVRLTLLAMFTVCALSSDAQRAEETQTIKGFRVPEYDEEGRLKSQLFGQTARIRPNGAVDVTEASVELYGPDGSVDARISTPQCRYERQANRVYSDAEVRIARDNLLITGRGFDWAADRQTFNIHTNVKVVLKEAQRALTDNKGEPR